jgi:hypothetical protein
MAIKVGDKVKINMEVMLSPSPNTARLVDKTGVVTQIENVEPWPFLVKFDDPGLVKQWAFNENELEVIE